MGMKEENGQPADKAVVDEVLAGRVEAFSLLVWRWERPLYSFLVRLSGDRELARDLSQDAFLRAFTRLKDLRDKEKFAPWLFRIAVHAFWSHVRSRPAPADSGGQAAIPQPGTDLHGSVLGSQEHQLAVRELILRLPQEQREALLLKVYHGFKFDEIATIVDCPASTVKSRLYKAFETIRAAWDDPNPPENP